MKQINETAVGVDNIAANDEPEKDEEQMDVTLQTVVNEKDGYGKLLLNHAKLHDFEIINCRRKELKKKGAHDNANDVDNKEGVEDEETNIAATGHCIVLVTQNERSFITHLGVMETFQPSHTILHELVQCRSANPTFTNHHHHIHIAGYYNSPQFHSKHAVKKRIKLIREKRRTQSHGLHLYTTTISLTPQYDATERWDTDELFNLLPLVDFLILNLVEACKISKVNLPEDNIEDCEDTEALRYLLLKLADYLDMQSPQTYVVVTLGKGGAVLLYGGDIVHFHRAPVKYDSPVDTTGAGDAFVSGFLFGVMNWRRERQHNQVHEIGSVLEEAGGWTDAIEVGMEWGCVTGTACVMKAGASVPSSKAEIENLLYYDGEDEDSDEKEDEDYVEVDDEDYDSKDDSDYKSEDDSDYNSEDISEESESASSEDDDDSFSEEEIEEDGEEDSKEAKK